VPTFSLKVDECKPLHAGRAPAVLQQGRSGPGDRPAGMGLHSSTFRLNLSATCGIGGAFRGSLGGVREYYGVSKVCFRVRMAQVELRSGRV